MFFVGIDTSCYTSSIAVVDQDENLIYDGRILLEVGAKERGLRQSDALYQHGNNLPGLCSEAMSRITSQKPVCIGVSTVPRKLTGSYMPVFTAGHNLAKVISSCTGAKLIECSHQQGHILAGVWSIQKQYEDSFIVYHISGGTTELLQVDSALENIEIIGGTTDLNAGQYIDRVGVSLEIQFPCGKEMDKLCKLYSPQALELPISVKGAELSFSGPESHVQRLINKETALQEDFKAKIAASVFQNIASAIEKTILHACQKSSIKNVLLVGGVASNSIIRETLTNSRKLRADGIALSISMPQFSSDNAVGAAIYAKREYLKSGGFNGL